MEALIGITGHDFVILAADRRCARSIVVMKGSEEKFRDLGKAVVLAYCGEPGDAVNFAEYVQGSVKLYEMRSELLLSTHAAAHYTRRLLADALRTRSAYQTNVLIAGTNERDGAQLFWIDHLAALTQVPFAAHGYAAYFVLSLMDRHYRKDMNVEEALALLKMCLAELKTRFIVNLPEFSVKIIRSTGVETTVVLSP